MNGAKLADRTPARILLVGYPGAGKTGALAPLVDAGFKVRFIDFDGNYEPMLRFVKDKSKLANVDIVTLEDKMRNGQRWTEVAGIPTAFSDAFKLMDRWKYKDENGVEVDLGDSKDWGMDTIVVLDSLTKMGDAAYRRAMVLANKTPVTMTQAVWKLAIDDQMAFIERLTSKQNRHHVIVMSHLKLISPKDAGKDASDTEKDIKAAVAELTPTRLFPSALGQQLPTLIGGEFPTLLLAEPEYGMKSVKRVIRSVPRPDLDLKAAAPDLPAVMPIDTALLTVFDAVTPGVQVCLADHGKVGVETPVPAVTNPTA